MEGHSMSFEASNDVARVIENLRQRELAAPMPEPTSRQADVRGLPAYVREVDLATIFNSGTQGVELGSGRKLYYLREGSNPLARLILEAGGRITRLAPGVCVDAPFDGARLFWDAEANGDWSTLEAELTTAGAAAAFKHLYRARFLVLTADDAGFSEAATPRGQVEQWFVAPGVAASQSVAAANQAIGGANAPGAWAEDGPPLVGVRGVRVVVQTIDGSNITGGSVRLWHFTPGSVQPFWQLGQVEETLKTGLTGSLTSDFEVTVPGGGFIYASAHNVTTDGAPGMGLRVYLQLHRAPWA
jgi:hypothetical protein